MLKRLQRRIVVITMLLVGVVLLIVLAASTISTVQAERTRIDQALAWGVREGPGANLPLIDNSNQSAAGSEAGAGVAGVAGVAEVATGSSLTPVYVMRVNLLTGLIISDNSSFISLAPELVETALTQIEQRLQAQVANEPQGLPNLQSLQSLQDLQENLPSNQSLPSLPLSSSITVIGSLNASTLDYRAELNIDYILTIALADSSHITKTALRQTLISLAIWFGAMLILLAISLLLARIVTRPIAEAWSRQRRFVADASHELKTPLTVILANTNLLAAHPNKTIAEQGQWIANTQAEAERMDCLLRDLLFLAQADEEVEKGGGLKARNSLDLSALLERSLLHHEALFYERGVTLVSKITPDISIVGNEADLERLFHILLDNASKYAADQATVVLTEKAGGGSGARVQLSIWNNGEAIRADALPHIFERFYRGDESHSDSEGYGLGLSLAQAIVQAQGGSITARSSIEDGTTLEVWLK
ncbi:MAG: HAMP domain-containing histidine kinase [Coriobacteriales bacterium]|jgi:signal transduction histidine kinase|nr:HAMP domain-containing histidine kinase [Coriobacteriales bacterium]